MVIDVVLKREMIDEMCIVNYFFCFKDLFISSFR